MKVNEVLNENEKLPDWFRTGAIVTLNPDYGFKTFKPEAYKTELKLSVNRSSGMASCKPVDEEDLYAPSFGGGTPDMFLPVEGKN